MSNWLLPSLSDIFQRAGQSPLAQQLPGSTAERQLQAELEWRAAVSAIEALSGAYLLDSEHQAEAAQGVMLCGPLPVLSNPEVGQHLATWVFVSDVLNAPLGLSLQLNPFHAAPCSRKAGRHGQSLPATPITSVPILEQDPIAVEQFCLMLTPEFSIILILGQDAQRQPCFQFSFEPKVIQMCWQALLLRVRLSNGSYAAQLHRLFEIFPPEVPDPQLLSRFTQYFIRQLSYGQLQATLNGASAPTQPVKAVASDEKSAPDVALLKAISHEVRTPLATIRTLTRLLLRRKDLAPDVLKRLGIIDNECTEQIDRFSLIFKAAELGEHPPEKSRPLATVSLSQVLQEGLPRWQNQAERRNLKLSLEQPEQMPYVVSDPPMLDQALTGLIDRFTRQLPGGSSLGLQVSLAGNQLKLQFRAEDDKGRPIPATLAESGPEAEKLGYPQPLGQLLSFQPATGSVSLNLAVTKNLFQALGGKLRVKERPQPGEIVTVFLPLHEPQMS